jgi:hypothetical protein
MTLGEIAFNLAFFQLTHVYRSRIYGTRTPLPDGRDSREYLAHLHALENEAKAAKRGGWGMVQP